MVVEASEQTWFTQRCAKGGLVKSGGSFCLSGIQLLPIAGLASRSRVTSPWREAGKGRLSCPAVLYVRDGNSVEVVVPRTGSVLSVKSGRYRLEKTGLSFVVAVLC